VNFVAYAVGVCSASVCTSLSDTDTAARLNIEYPTGVGPWKIADGPFADGTPNGADCPDTPGHRHMLFVC
jgi:hypothetical protein